MSDKKPLDGTRLGRMVDQAVDLSELESNPDGTATPAMSEAKAKADPPGWRAATARLEKAGGQVEVVAAALGIFPDFDVVRTRLLDTFVPGARQRIDRRLPFIFRALWRRRRNRLAAELAGFAYGNALTLAIVAVEAERERKQRRKVGAR